MTATKSVTFTGSVNVCCHTVSFQYDLHELDLTPELEEALAEEAESRATALIAGGCHSGELNCLWQGETEIRGWFEIDRS